MQTQINFRTVWQNPIHFVAFGFGSGTFPFAPGTIGTLFAIPFYLFMRDWSPLVYLAVVLVAIVIGIWICSVTEKVLGVHDYSGMNFDEFTGYWVTMFMAPHHWQWVATGFLLFRLFDIWKPWPINWLDRYVGGGFGVMVDDLLAGVYAWVVLQVLVHLHLF